jgi:MbtH protein
MSNPFDREDASFHVLINDERQYSLWPDGIEVPAGWQKVFSGLNSECVAYVDREWTDMRPESLRRQMGSDG